MMFSALKQESESVFVDLLTYADLEMLKSRKKGKTPSSNSTVTRSNRRYLILTYVVEFDRVHYPLPLAFEENPDPHTLTNTIRRLRQEIEDLQNDVELRRLREENSRLKEKISRLSDDGASVDGECSQCAASRHELEKVQKEKEQVEMTLERVRRDAAREAKSLRKECEKKSQDLESQTIEMEELKKQAEQSLREDEGDPKEVRLLRRKVAQLEEELNAERATAKRSAMKRKKEMQSLVEEMEKTKQSESGLRLRCRELTNELQLLTKRSPSSSSRPKLSSSSRLSPRPLRPKTPESRPGNGRSGSAPPRSSRFSPTPSRDISPMRSRIRTPPSLPDRPPLRESPRVRHDSPRVRNDSPRVRNESPRQRDSPRPSPRDGAGSRDRPSRPSSAERRGTSPRTLSHRGSDDRQRTSPRSDSSASGSTNSHRRSPKIRSPSRADSKLLSTTKKASSRGVLKEANGPPPTYEELDRLKLKLRRYMESDDVASSTDPLPKPASKASPYPVPAAQASTDFETDAEATNPRRLGGYEPGSDMSDIDARLSALQTFLKQAKANLKGGHVPS